MGTVMSHDMAAIAGQLRQAGYRVPPQRQMILDAVCALGEHVTPEAVYERVQSIAPTLNRATVYRCLHFLAEQHILTVTSLTDGRLGYELAGPEPHHHLVCRSCGMSVELPHHTLDRLYASVETDFDFVIDMDHISFLGQCAACRRRETKVTIGSRRREQAR
jgi:Fur family ferric uptake transcriptional regulator